MLHQRRDEETVPIQGNPPFDKVEDGESTGAGCLILRLISRCIRRLSDSDFEVATSDPTGTCLKCNRRWTRSSPLSEFRLVCHAVLLRSWAEDEIG